jgi:hypothetical protein
MEEDRKILQGKLMNSHRLIMNEISDIRANSDESTIEEDRKKIKLLENKLKLISDSLYNLYRK